MTSNVQYTLVGAEEGANISVFVAGHAPQVAHSSHPHFDSILAGALAGDASVIDLFDVATSAATKFERLTERVTTANGYLFLDGVELHSALATQVIRFIEQGVEDWKPLVAFFEKVQANPQEHSREQLYTWLIDRDFAIYEDGDILGYKGVRQTDGKLVSIHSGQAIVDGTVVKGYIPNEIGSIIEMPRDEVTFDPSVGCHNGLHVGNYSYAEGFAQGALLEVKVNPRDVVSVPSDSYFQKMRVCRYTVIKVIDQQVTTALRVYDQASDTVAWGDGEDSDTDYYVA